MAVKNGGEKPKEKMDFFYNVNITSKRKVTYQ